MATTMYYREIELTIFTAQELRDVRIFGGKMSPYAVAWVNTGRKVKGPVDEKGGIDPKWNYKFQLYAEERQVHEERKSVVVHIELFDAGVHWGSKIGMLSFSLADLPGRKGKPVMSESEAVFLSLPVRRPSGHEQGTLNFSVRLGDITDTPVAVQRAESNSFRDFAMGRTCCNLPLLKGGGEYS